MLGRTNTKGPARRLRAPLAIAATAAALVTVALFPAAGLATNKIEVGINGTSIVVNGTTISTSNLTLAQLANLQGVPPATVKAELDGVALNTPAAPAVEALVAGLPLEATLASVLEGISSATGGAVSPQTALRQVIGDEGQPGAAGAGGANGSGGAPGSSGAATGPGAAGGACAGKAGAKKRFTLHAVKRSLKGHPGSRVRVRFNVSSAAKLSYSGRKLAKGSRKVKPGANVLSFKLPRTHGNYKLVLQAVSTPDGQRAQTTIVLHDATAKKRH
jgi:hypothetical protein